MFILKMAIKEVDTEDDAGVTIHDLDTRYRVIVRKIVDQPASISGKKFRLLRIEFDLFQKTVGDLIGGTDQVIAK